MSPAIVTRNAVGCALLFNLKQSGKWSAGSERDDGNQLRGRSWCRAPSRHSASQQTLRL